MSLRKTFEELCDRLDDLFRAVDRLQKEARDKPAGDDVALAQILDRQADDLHGWLAEASGAAAAALQAVGPPVDLERARLSLLAAQEHCSARFAETVSDVLSYDRLDEVRGVPLERGDKWRDWSEDVTEALGACRERLDALTQAFFLCWQELSERVALGGVSVQATNIGQQVMVPREEFVAEGSP